MAGQSFGQKMGLCFAVVVGSALMIGSQFVLDFAEPSRS